MALGSLILGSPAALWALAAIPVLLAIHLLQQKALRMETSTLFLLHRIAPETSEGRRIDWIKSSLPLWLQLLAIAATVWVLVDPHFVAESSVQRAVIVLDSSASMSVFRETMTREVERMTGEMAKSAARTEWILIDTDTTSKTIYSGTDRTRAMEAVRTFEASNGAHDFGPALSLALGLARGKGPVLLVTDHDVPVPAGVSLLAVGRALENVGFTGLLVQRTAGGVEWTAAVKNHGRSAATRTLSLDGSEPRQLTLEAGEVRLLRGTFPKADQARLVLTADDFALDDTVPVVRPRRKVLRLYVEPSAQPLEVVQRLTAGLESSALIADPRGADVVIAARTRDQANVSGNAIVFLIDDAPEKKNDLAPVLAERGPLTEGLAWSGLLRRKMGTFDLESAPVLWQGDRPLVSIRSAETKRQLMVSFDPRHSNAERVPSFAVLLLRFVESVRAEKAELEARNLETRQALELAIRGEGEVVLRTEKGETRISPREAASMIAPSEPGFFFVQQGDVMLLAGAARFGDLREADFSEALSASPDLEALRALALRNARPDPLRALWILLGAGACLGAWLAQARRRA